MTVLPTQHGTFPLWKPVRGGDTTLVEQLETEFAERIETHRLRPGSRLPSVRKMAESAGLSRYTVMEAYERLLARGLVLSRPSAGEPAVTPTYCGHAGRPRHRCASGSSSADDGGCHAWN
ncbi:DNA-binding transcriptional MocR family regulator [Gluconobacter cerinus]|uniref:winged helix-turn-helix domain-containing protein n=1 Tax=Gluconobacter cerinus TaxID=38307 RepID=UPI002226677A|nr:winged helix-turn-helix domain-containing protein [Gluconobacter cerinus]MCW2265064.1 DNA-binding transcriptional MocR family regulator [Gluconobacter cerinus]